MSSAGTFGDGGGGGGRDTAPQNYFCYQCEQTVTISPSPSPNSELVCPNCHGGFLEESETAPPPIPAAVNPDILFPPLFGGGGGGSGGGFPFVFSPTSGGGEIDLASIFGSAGAGYPMQSPNEFNPFAFLNNYLNNMRAGGANIQIVFENPGGGLGIGMGGGGGGIPLNFGDYFLGPGLEQLIQQLAENDPNRYGTPPAAKSAVEGLPDIKMTEELLASDSSQCAVCIVDFELDEEVKEMPCKHIYHKDCIFPWLELHNSCPVCRYELPTDDPDYESRRNGQQCSNNDNNSIFGVNVSSAGNLSPVSGGLSSGGNQETPQTPRTVERRFRISLPSLFRGFGSSAETSSSGGAGNSDGGNNGSNQNNNNSGGSNTDSGGQAKMEDLD